MTKRSLVGQLLHDERGKPSMARTLLFFWTVQCGIVIWLPWVTVGALALCGSIETALIAWAAGPRIAQYIGPQIAAVGSAIASTFRKGRDAEQALEPSPDHGTEAPDA